jgi:hypothetical protein
LVSKTTIGSRITTVTFEQRSQLGPRRSRPSVSRWIFAQLAALGHLGAIVSVITKELRGRQYYRAKFERFRALEQVGLAVADLAPTIPAPPKTQ